IMETTCEGVSRYVVYFTKGLADVVLSEVSALAPGITVGEPADRFAVVTADAASPGWLAAIRRPDARRHPAAGRRTAGGPRCGGLRSALRAGRSHDIRPPGHHRRYSCPRRPGPAAVLRRAARRSARPALHGARAYLRPHHHQAAREVVSGMPGQRQRVHC